MSYPSSYGQSSIYRPTVIPDQNISSQPQPTPGFRDQNPKSGYNPCCMPLRTGTLVVGIVFLVLNIIVILSLTVFPLTDKDKDAKMNPKTVSIILVSINAAISVVLIIGAALKNRYLCIIWIIIFTILTVFDIAVLIYGAVKTHLDEGSLALGYIAFLLLKAYSLEVVVFYVMELTTNIRQQRQGLASNNENSKALALDESSGDNSGPVDDDSSLPYQTQRQNSGGDLLKDADGTANSDPATSGPTAVSP